MSLIARPDGTVLVGTGGGIFRFDKDGKAVTQVCCTNKDVRPGADGRGRSPRLGLDVTGKPWLTFALGTVLGEGLVNHPGSATVRRLTGVIPDPNVRGSDRILRYVSPGGVAVVDSTTVLAGTYTYPDSTFWHGENSIVYRVHGTGPAVAVAGRPGHGTTNPVSALRPGQIVPATSVSLETVQTIIPLTTDSFVILMPSPVSDQDAPEARVQAALVRGETISRLALPGLCAWQDHVTGSRISATTLVVNAPNPKNGSCVNRNIFTDEMDAYRWVQVHTDGSPPVTLGTGAGLATISGGDLMTAVIVGQRYNDGRLQVARRPLKPS